MSTIREKLAGKTSKLAIPRERMKNHPADPSDYQEGAFCTVEVSKITPDPNQPRKYFDPDSLAELSRSIEQTGVLQPVIIRKGALPGEIYLVAGERRYRAAKMAGLAKIPAIITKGNPMEIAIIENLQRENLRPIEEAEALGRMVEEYSYTHEQLAFVIGKARSTITETLGLNRLPEEVKEQCRQTDVYPRRLLVEVAKQESPRKMKALFEKIKAVGLKSSEVRKITRKNPRQAPSPAAVALGKIAALDECLRHFDLATSPPDEAAQMRAALRKLKTRIDELLG